MNQVTMTNDQFQQLLDTLRNNGNRSPTPTSSISVNSANTGNFARCTLRFSGTESDNVDIFLDGLLAYKSCENVTDPNALLGLSFVLEGDAAIYWKAIQKDITDFNSAVTALRETFSRKLPPPAIFRKIFASEQSSRDSTELFISKIRALLAELPYALPEEAQIDIVYSVLHSKITQRLLRSCITNFADFVKRVREIEASLRTLSSLNTQPSPETSTKTPRPPKCNYCHVIGHTRDNCLKRTAKRSQLEAKKDVLERPPPTADQRPDKQPKCYGCGKLGVYRSNCPDCRSKNNPPLSADTNQSAHVSTLTIHSRPILPIMVDGFSCRAVADTGAQLSIAGHELYTFLKSSGHVFRETFQNVSYADGIPREVKALETDVRITLERHSIPLTLLVFPDCHSNNTLLGADFLTKAGVVLNLADNSWFYARTPNRCHLLLMEIPKEPLTQLSELQAYSLRENEATNLSPQQKNDFNALLEENADIFRTGGAVPTNFAVHHIKTQPCQPKAVPPYAVNGAKRKFLREELDRLLAEGIVEECESAWSSPVVLVPKSGGTYRMCVDYRKLNSVTVTDTYPMPKIDELLHSARSTTFMSTIDLQQGFWQVPVADEDRDKTCFVTPFGTFRFKRMAFGLKNAPATFVRLMDRFRAGLGNRNVFVYMDDILVLSETYEQHLQDLSAVFDRLRMFNLRARREKCVFVRDEVKYLGHTISPAGLVPDRSKVSAIADMPAPSTVKQVASFVQTCSWYRKFIPGFSALARPLTNLLKKSAVFQFGEEQRHAFETLKAKLTSAPILRQADSTKPYMLRTDASDYALGSVLLQGEGNEERPIEYASRLLTPAERNYSTVEKEALAVVWSVTRFRSYLDSAEVTVSSDCQALQWLFALKTPTGRLARWALQLQGANLKMTYTPGRKNVVADTLSRPFCKHASDVSCAVCTVTIELPSLGYENFRAQQTEDPETKKIIDILESADDPQTKSWLERGFLLINGVLYHQTDDFDQEDPQLVIPAQCRAEIMSKYHDAPTAGHCGVDRTYRTIAIRFYFSGMRKYIKDFVASCPQCQRYKVLNKKPTGFLQTPAPAQRFETLAVDLFGPLPETKTGNRWILVVEDLATKWTELFSLPSATADACAKTLIEEVFLRYGTPRKLISDNGVQFISDVMQKVTYCFKINTPFIPLYHASSNPVERKNRDLKTMLAILVENEHSKWDEYLPSIRFALNSTYTVATGYSPAFLSFGREVRAPHDALYDFRRVVAAENFVPRITPYLHRLADCLQDSVQHVLREQDRRKVYADQSKRDSDFKMGDQVLVKSHNLSDAAKGFSSKLSPRRDGPYILSKKLSPTAFVLSTLDGEEVGRYHVGDLTPFQPREDSPPQHPFVPKRRRGRPAKVQNLVAEEPTREASNQRQLPSSTSSPPVCRPRGRPRKTELNVRVPPSV